MKVPPILRWGTESPECLLRADTYSDFLASHWRRETGKTRCWAQAGVWVCVFGVLGCDGICPWQSTTPHPGKEAGGGGGGG